MSSSTKNNIIMPKNLDSALDRIKNEKISKENKSKWDEFLEQFWTQQKIDPRDLITNMDFVGGIQSKRNFYYCYKYHQYNVLSTGFKEITRPNIILDSEKREISKFITEMGFDNPFTIDELEDVVRQRSFSSERIQAMINYTTKEAEVQNPLYWQLLQCCYVLTAENKLALGKDGRKVKFSINPRVNQVSNERDIYRSFSYVNMVKPNTWLFENELLYFTLRLKNFRGSIVPYIKDEIEYLNNCVSKIKIGTTVNISDIGDDLDYSKRFHKIYSLIEFRNIRNVREDRDFFVSRIKNSLEVVETLYNTVEVKKESRRRVFTRV